MKVLLASICALLVGVLAWQWVGWDERQQFTANAVDDGQSAAPVLAKLPNVADILTPPPPRGEYVSVIERTLFLPDRRIPESRPEPAPESASQPEPVDDGALRGLDFNAVLLSDTVSIGWIRLPPERNLRRLQKGDKIHQWTVADIRKDRLLLRYQEAERQFMLRDYVNAPPPIPPTRLPVLPTNPQQASDGIPRGSETPPQAGKPPSAGDTPASKPKPAPPQPSFGPG